MARFLVSRFTPAPCPLPPAAVQSILVTIRSAGPSAAALGPLRMVGLKECVPLHDLPDCIWQLHAGVPQVGGGGTAHTCRRVCISSA